MASVIPNVDNSFLKQVYGDFDPRFFESRCSSLVDDFAENFSSQPDEWFSSPGRIEIVGNHTDHNNGKVLCASISLDTLACVKKTDDGVIRIHSGGYPMITVDLNNLSVNVKEYSTSTALVRGVAAFYKERGYSIGGFCASAHSTVFKGAGVSSSASFELLVAEILNYLYNDGKIDAVTKAVAAHHAESVFFGKPCGLLDQCAISLGGVSYIDFFDGQPHPMRLNSIPDLSVVLVNAGGDHSSLTDQYAAIRTEMNKVAGVFRKKVLRDVQDAEFFNRLPELRRKVSGRAILRAIHFFEENVRVEEAKAALENADRDSFVKAVNKSGESSMCLLQNCYPEGDKTQSIPSAVEILKRMDGVKASRVHGGGFAGTVIAFAEPSKTAALRESLDVAFGNENYFIVNVRKVGACRLPND